MSKNCQKLSFFSTKLPIFRRVSFVSSISHVTILPLGVCLEPVGHYLLFSQSLLSLFLSHTLVSFLPLSFSHEHLVVRKLLLINTILCQHLSSVNLRLNLSLRQSCSQNRQTLRHFLRLFLLLHQKYPTVDGLLSPWLLSHPA